MVFLDPKIDFVFKKLFGTIANKDILIFFLNSILEKKESEKIIDVEINNPVNMKDSKHFKESAVDVRCTDAQNNHYIVEMQVLNQKDFDLRIQYYSAFGITRQLPSAGRYGILQPVIFIAIVNFILFKPDQNGSTEPYFSVHKTISQQTKTQRLKLQEYYILELPKFTKKIHELATDIEKWTYFFKSGADCQTVPTAFKEESFKHAFHVLQESNWKGDELDAYQRYLDKTRSFLDQIDAAKDEGEIKGKINIAKSMLKKGLDLQLIAEITGLAIEEIKNIKE